MANAWIVAPLPFTAVASGTSLGNASYVANDYAGMVWRSDSATTPYLTIDLGADVSIDTIFMFGLVAPRGSGQFRVFGATAAEGVNYFGRFTANANPYAGDVPQASGNGVGLHLIPSSWPAVRYLRVQWLTGSAFQIQLSKLVIGKRTQLARNFSIGAAFGVRDLSSVDFGPYGNLLRRRAAKLRTVGLTFSSAFRDEVESAIAPLQELRGITEPIALCSNPDTDPMRERRCWFGPMVGDIGYIQRSAAAFEVKVSVIDLFPSVVP